MDTNKKNIFHLIESLNMGGAQKIIYQLASADSKNGYDHSICSLLQSGPYEKVMRDEGIDLVVLNAKRRSIILFPLFVYDLFCLLKRLVNIVKKKQIDILHAHLPDSSLIAIVIGWLTGTPVVLTIHNNFSLPSKRKAPLRDAVRTFVTNTVFKRADYIITVGNDIQDSLLKILGDKVTIKTVYNGVDYLRYSNPEKLDSLRFRQSLNVDDDARVIAMVGRLEKQKGHACLIDAAALLKGKYPDVVFLLVGDGELRDQLVEQAQRRKIIDNIVFLGNCDDVPAILGASDLFVLPSIYEGIPLVVLEAMAAGLPVIATDIAGTRELIESGVDGVLVATEDSEAIAHAIDDVLSDVGRSREMSVLAQIKVKERFTLQQMVSGTEDVYQEVLNAT